MSKLGTKQIVAAVLAVIAILGAATAIFFQTRPAGVNVKLHQAFGEALAEQVATITNAGKIALITLDSKKFPVLKAQQDGFEKGLRKYPNLKLDRTVEVNAESKAKYGPGRGLALDRYLRIAKKYSGRDDIIVSLIGAPSFKEDQLEKIPGALPKLIAETRGRDQLVQLFAAGLVQAAIVPRFVFPAPIEKPRTPRDWFEVYWQVINPSNVSKDEAPAEDSEVASEKPSPHPKTRPSKTNSEPAKVDSPESGSTQKPSSTPQ